MSESRRVPAFESRTFTEQLKVKNRTRREDLARMQQATSARPTRNDLAPELALVNVPIGDLRLPTRRLRKADQAHIQEVARSISALGFSSPVIVGSDNLVLDGAIRVDAARMLGLSHVPCVRVEHLSGIEQRALRLALNRLGETGQWNLGELKIEFEELILTEAPIEIVGFTVDEIDQILLDDEPLGVEVGPLTPDESGVAVARLGDVFQLGPHRLVCGDATDAHLWRVLMHGDGPARLLFTDVPYNVKIAGNVSTTGRREFVMGSGEMSDPEYLAFNRDWMAAPLPYLVEGAVVGTYIDWRGLPTVHAAAASLGLAALNLIVWGKTNAGMGSLYRSQHELCPLYKKGNAPHVNNIALGKRGRWRSNLWTYPGASSLGSDARRGLQDHPTVKPVVMLEDALFDLTNRGELVLDPFLGSGSTLIACEKTGRICRGLELDPLYVDVICRRFQALTGAEAVLVETGDRFTELAARRSRESSQVGEGADFGSAPLTNATPAGESEISSDRGSFDI